MPSVTPEEARLYTERWALVRAFELEELRRTSMETKLRQLASLMESRDLFADHAERENAVQEVRSRWASLREALSA